MTRILDSAVETGVTAQVVPYAIFAEFEFATGTLRMWSGLGTKSHDGEDWTGLGDLTGMGPVDETTEIGASALNFTLTSVKSSLRAIALADKYRGRVCRVWLAILDTDLSTVLGTYRIFAGRMNTMALTAASETMSTISLTVESRIVDLRRSRPSRYTAAEQKRIDASDTGLDRTAKIAERPLNWGVAATTPAAAPSYSGFKYPRSA
jgi:hypothetical protein